MKKRAQPGGFYCGTSNVVLPVPNKTYFPMEFRDKSRLAYYSSLFNTVEINSTFYKVPQKKTVVKWAEEVTDGFLFMFKLWRGISHAKELHYDKADIVRFVDVISGVGGKKGCLLIQFPASIKFSLLQRVHQLLKELFSVRGAAEWKVAIEFRDRSWYNDTVYELIEGLGMAIVAHDKPASRTPFIDMDTPFSYFRFHGEKGNYRGSYDQDVLIDHAHDVASRVRSGQTVFAYFNNTIGAAVANAMSLQELVTG
jgi:uncharacterized protein YecE (DUF72 family)